MAKKSRGGAGVRLKVNRRRKKNRQVGGLTEKTEASRRERYIPLFVLFWSDVYDACIESLMKCECLRGISVFSGKQKYNIDIILALYGG